MKHAITIPSIVPGRRVRWSFELSAERQELAVPPLASGPQTSALIEAAPSAEVAPPWTPSVEQTASSPIAMRKGTPGFTLALAAGAAAIVVSLALVRYLAADEEYEVADSSFGSQGAASDPESTAEPIAKAPATPPAPPAVVPAAAAPPTPIVRPAPASQIVIEAASTPPAKAAKIAAVSAPAPTAVATPVVDAREPEPAAASAAEVASAARTSPPAAPPATAASASADEVTITGCLEIGKDEDGFRLADTEGANVPQARSWRSGFFKKRPAAVDLVGSTEALSLERQVGRRVAATGVLNSRKLKVSSLRVVSPSCN